MGLFSNLKGMATEIFDLPYGSVNLGKPTPHSTPDVISLGQDHNGYDVYEIEANNYAIAAEVTDGTTVEGPVHKALDRTGHNRWKYRVEGNDTQGLK